MSLRLCIFKELLLLFQKVSIHNDRYSEFWIMTLQNISSLSPCVWVVVQRFSRVGSRGRARKWATLGVHPLSWLLSNNRLEEVCGTLTKGTFSSRLLLSNQDKGCTPSPSVAHSLPLPLPPGFCSPCQICSAYEQGSSPYVVIINDDYILIISCVIISKVSRSERFFFILC